MDDSSQKFVWGQPQLDSLRIFLMEAFGWSEEKADQVLLPVLREMNSRKVYYIYIYIYIFISFVNQSFFLFNLRLRESKALLDRSLALRVLFLRDQQLKLTNTQVKEYRILLKTGVSKRKRKEASNKADLYCITFRAIP